MPEFEIVELDETDSTNRMAAEVGRAWQAFTAKHQTAGRGRLDHRWLAPPGVNLALSAVLPVAGWTAEEVSTLPLVVGYAVLQAVVEVLDNSPCLPTGAVAIKWPNDVLIDGLKVGGILCERHGDNVIVGIGVNVLPRKFPPEIAKTATFLARFQKSVLSVNTVRDAVLRHLGEQFERVRRGSFAAVYSELKAYDWLNGRTLAVLQTDTDTEPLRGVCGGIQPDGSLAVGDKFVYAGEAHILKEKS